jgi:hypothetical protein
MAAAGTDLSRKERKGDMCLKRRRRDKRKMRKAAIKEPRMKRPEALNSRRWSEWSV